MSPACDHTTQNNSNVDFVSKEIFVGSVAHMKNPKRFFKKERPRRAHVEKKQPDDRAVENRYGM